MKNGIVLAVILVGTSAVAGAERARARVFECESPPAAEGKIDQLVFARLAELGIERAHGCSHTVFLRRVDLDVIGSGKKYKKCCGKSVG